MRRQHQAPPEGLCCCERINPTLRERRTYILSSDRQVTKCPSNVAVRAEEKVRKTSRHRNWLRFWVCWVFTCTGSAWSPKTNRKRIPKLYSNTLNEYFSYQAASTGLSKFHQSILSRRTQQQKFVTGEFPLIVSFIESPTRKWLGQFKPSTGNVEVLINGTTPLRSLASLDRFDWLDDEERDDLLKCSAIMSVELIAEINVDNPAYVNMLPKFGSPAIVKTEEEIIHRQRPVNKERLWITGFSLTGGQGRVTSVDNEGNMQRSTKGSTSQLLWPNEVHGVPREICTEQIGDKSLRDAILVSDGFLIPGKDRGGIYVVNNPGQKNREVTRPVTRQDDRWFYHRSIWIDLTNDGRKSILTARCRVSTPNIGKNQGVTSGLSKDGELVWLECPEPHSFDPVTGIPVEEDGTPFDPLHRKYLPWREHVLAQGPDVMFCVADIDPTDDTVEVISSQFFSKKVVLHSIRRQRHPRIAFERVIDDECGVPFGCILADLSLPGNKENGSLVCDSGSTVETLAEGDRCSHLLVTTHEQTYDPREGISVTTKQQRPTGGSLFSYRIPTKNRAWKSEAWLRSTVATGFKVNSQLGNVINPGAPGFVYTFFAQHGKEDNQRPLIAIAGDCAESAYILRPDSLREEHSDCEDPSTSYNLMLEIKCGATVGSIGIGYEDFAGAGTPHGYAKLFIPCYEKDRILVFALGSGLEDELDDDIAW